MRCVRPPEPEPFAQGAGRQQSAREDHLVDRSDRLGQHGEALGDAAAWAIAQFGPVDLIASHG